MNKATKQDVSNLVTEWDKGGKDILECIEALGLKVERTMRPSKSTPPIILEQDLSMMRIAEQVASKDYLDAKMSRMVDEYGITKA